VRFEAYNERQVACAARGSPEQLGAFTNIVSHLSYIALRGNGITTRQKSSQAGREHHLLDFHKVRQSQPGTVSG
jgi:hypothetical protein